MHQKYPPHKNIFVIWWIIANAISWYQCSINKPPPISSYFAIIFRFLASLQFINTTHCLQTDSQVECRHLAFINLRRYYTVGCNTTRNPLAIQSSMHITQRKFWKLHWSGFCYIIYRQKLFKWTPAQYILGRRWPESHNRKCVFSFMAIYLKYLKNDPSRSAYAQ